MLHNVTNKLSNAGHLRFFSKDRFFLFFKIVRLKKFPALHFIKVLYL